MKKVSVLIPAFNEEKNIYHTIEAVQASKLVDNILVIDDGSKDNTKEIALSSGVKVLSLEENKGKGYALKRGINEVVDKNQIVVFLDADLRDTALEVDKLIIPVLEDKCDVAIARFKPPKSKGGFGMVKKLAKEGVRFYTGYNISYSLSGQRAYKSEVLKNIKWLPSNYGIEVSMTIDILRLGYRIKEIDVDMIHRETDRNINGFIHRGKQFIQIFKTLVEINLR